MKMVLTNSQDDISIMSLKRDYPGLFYNQDWYEDEEFAHLVLPRGEYRFGAVFKGQALPALGDHLPSAVACAWAFVHTLMFGQYTLWPDVYVWCKDTDKEGDRVYVGGVQRGRNHGFQIHRYLTLQPWHTTVAYQYEK